MRLAKATDFTYIAEPLATYRVSQGSLVHREIELTLTNSIRALLGLFDNSEALYLIHRDRYRSTLAEKYAHLGYYYLSELRAKEARGAAWKALSYRRREKMAWMVLVGSFVPNALLDWIRKLKTASKNAGADEGSESA